MSRHPSSASARIATAERAVRAARVYRPGVTAGPRELARAYSVSRAAITMAIAVHRARPELLDEVLAGRLTLTAAYEQTRTAAGRDPPEPVSA